MEVARGLFDIAVALAAAVAVGGLFLLLIGGVARITRPAHESTARAIAQVPWRWVGAGLVIALVGLIIWGTYQERSRPADVRAADRMDTACHAYASYRSGANLGGSAVDKAQAAADIDERWQTVAQAFQWVRSYETYVTGSAQTGEPLESITPSVVLSRYRLATGVLDDTCAGCTSASTCISVDDAPRQG